MNITTAEITSAVGSFMWPFFRVGALFMAAPITGAQTIPTRFRIALALVVTLIIAPLLPAPPAVDPFSFPAISIIAQQLLIGIAMGFSLQLTFAALTTGGQIVALQMGLSFASMVDPQNGQQVPVLSQLYLLVSTLLFLGFDAHLLMVQMLVDSFRVVPIGPDGIDRTGMWEMVSWGSRMFSAAVWISLPAVASLLVVNFAFGVMAKAAPQLHIFSIGFPVTIIMGFIVVMYVLPTLVPQFTGLLHEGFELMSRVVAGGR